VTLFEDDPGGAPVGTDPAQPSALHVNDAAFTVQRMIAEATPRGYRWDFLPKAAPTQEWNGLVRRAQRAAIGAAWVLRLKRLAPRYDIVQVHSASTLAHSRFAAPRYVLHCHGSDVRTAQYDPARGPSIRAGLREAEAVFYPTPDVAEHVLPHRSDAIYLPIPIDVANVPKWTAAEGRPRVLFASRWTADKDSSTPQTEIAAALVAAVGDRAEVVGLDWGPQASVAAAAGVRLVPRADHTEYLNLLTTSHVVIGQSAGILATSELEALGSGTPVVLAIPLPLYASDPPPVYGGSVQDAVDATVALLDGSQSHDPDTSRNYIQRVHGIEQTVDVVAEVHRDVMAARR
jgi:hypothetical protein